MTSLHKLGALGTWRVQSQSDLVVPIDNRDEAMPSPHIAVRHSLFARFLLSLYLECRVTCLCHGEWRNAVVFRGGNGSEDGGEVVGVEIGASGRVNVPGSEEITMEGEP
jgi:hypothetical protein